VGIVNDFKLDQNQSYYKINVRLFNDMTNVGYVYVIENRDLEEIKELAEQDE